MTPTLSYLAVPDHLDGLYRDARRERGEARARQMTRPTSPSQVARRTRRVPLASHQ
jgi:hypothetical protein